MFLVHSYVDLQVTEQLWVQPDRLIAQEVLQAAGHITWDTAYASQIQILLILFMQISLHPQQQNLFIPVMMIRRLKIVQ